VSCVRKSAAVDLLLQGKEDKPNSGLDYNQVGLIVCRTGTVSAAILSSAPPASREKHPTEGTVYAVVETALMHGQSITVHAYV